MLRRRFALRFGGRPRTPVAGVKRAGLGGAAPTTPRPERGGNATQEARCSGSAAPIPKRRPCVLLLAGLAPSSVVDPVVPPAAQAPRAKQPRPKRGRPEQPEAAGGATIRQQRRRRLLRARHHGVPRSAPRSSGSRTSARGQGCTSRRGACLGQASPRRGPRPRTAVGSAVGRRRQSTAGPRSGGRASVAPASQAAWCVASACSGSAARCVSRSSRRSRAASMHVRRRSAGERESRASARHPSGLGGRTIAHIAREAPV